MTQPAGTFGSALGGGFRSATAVLKNARALDSAAALFESAGTPAGRQIAELMRNDAIAAGSLIQQFGGAKNLFDVVQTSGMNGVMGLKPFLEMKAAGLDADQFTTESRNEFANRRLQGESFNEAQSVLKPRERFTLRETLGPGGQPTLTQVGNESGEIRETGLEPAPQRSIVTQTNFQTPPEVKGIRSQIRDMNDTLGVINEMKTLLLAPDAATALGAVGQVSGTMADLAALGGAVGQKLRSFVTEEATKSSLIDPTGATEAQLEQYQNLLQEYQGILRRDPKISAFRALSLSLALRKARSEFGGRVPLQGVLANLEIIGTSGALANPVRVRQALAPLESVLRDDIRRRQDELRDFTDTPRGQIHIPEAAPVVELPESAEERLAGVTSRFQALPPDRKREIVRRAKELVGQGMGEREALLEVMDE